MFFGDWFLGALDEAAMMLGPQLLPGYDAVFHSERRIPPTRDSFADEQRSAAARFRALRNVSRSCSPFNWHALSVSGLLPGFRVPYFIGNSDFLLSQIRRHRLLPVTAAAEGSSLEDVLGTPSSGSAAASRILGEQGDEPRGVCLILGSESHGVSAKLRRESMAVSLPMSKMVDSLNVGIAGGILMEEVAGRVRL